MIFLAVLLSLAMLFSLAGVVYPFRPFRSRSAALLCFLGIVSARVGLSAVNAKNPPPREAQESVSTVVPAPAAKALPSSAIETHANWIYTVGTDDLTDAQSKLACAKSTNTLSFDFPYQGGSSGELCFRRNAKGLNAWLRISSGQFLCGLESCPLRARFDDGPVQSFQGVESSTHESTILFVMPAARFMMKTRAAKHLKVQTAFYQAGEQTLQFDVDGLDASKL